MSGRSNPFEELERLFERMSRQFDETSRSWDREGSLGQWMGGPQSVSVDLVERDEEYVATVDLPGFESDDVTVEVTDHTLHVEAERSSGETEESGQYVRQERRHESAKRSIRLPEEVDTENVDARMKNGVLTITLPKLETAPSRRIEIS